MAKKKKAVRRKKAAPKSVGLSTVEVRKAGETRELRELSSKVEDDGGAVLGSYSDPFGGTPVLLVALPIATACAYALARLPMRGRGFLLALILAVSMFPQISVVTPLYLILRELHLLNTYPGLVLPYVTFSTPLAVWLLTAFIRQLPRDLEDAAMIDGASRLRAARDVVLPLAAPGIASTAILTFLYCWNEFLFALSFTLGPERYTVPVAVMLFRSRYQVPWGEVLAATVIASVPIVVLVLTCQQRIVAGLSAGASKG